MAAVNTARSCGSAIVDRAPSRDWPPVLILNMFYSGLAIARQLSGKGMRVIGLSADHRTYGNFTRLCEVRRAPNSKDDPEGLAEFLLRTTEFQGAIVFPTRDADVMFLDRFRSQLERMYCLAIPPADCLRRTVDKRELARVAQAATIPVPRTLRLSSADELSRVPDEVGFPCVVKPVSAFEWHLADAWQRVGARKAIRVDSWESLRSEYRQISEVTRQVLVQEWIPGPADQIVVVGGYVGEGFELLAHFTARKILQSPDDCGTGCIVRSEPIPDILEPTRRLFHALRYQGLAEVEYKFDSRTGEYKLIEINTRHWDQHQLGDASGVNLSWVAYCHLTGRSVPEAEGPVVLATWIAEDALLMRLIRSVFHPELRTAHLRTKLSGPRMYGVFVANDPLPACRYFIGAIIPDLTRKALLSVRDFLWSKS
jgi:D-aspartate ligase